MAQPVLVDFSVATTIYAGSKAADITGLTKSTGDLLIIIASTELGHVLTNSDATYTLLYGISNGANCCQYVWYKVATASEANPTIALDTGNEPFIVVSMSISGWDSSTILYATEIGQTTAAIAPTLTANTDALVLRTEIHKDGSVTAVTPATEIQKGNSGATSSTQIYTAQSQSDYSGAGAVGPATFNFSGTARFITSTMIIHGTGGAIGSTIQIYEDPWYSGQVDVINGQNFEAAQASGVVTLTQDAFVVNFTVQSWSDTELSITAPAMLSTALKNGDTTLTVDPDTNSASTKAIQFLYSPNHSFVNLSTLATDLATRIEANDLLQPDWQLLYSTFLFDSAGTTLLSSYRVIIRDDATFTISGLPPDGTYKLPVAVYDSDTNTWTGFVNQTIIVDIGIGVSDTVAPVVTAPADITINIGLLSAGLAHNNSTLVTWLSSATSADAIAGNLSSGITNNLASTLANPIPAGGPYTIIFTSIDPAANVGTDTATLTVTQDVDTTGPVVTVPAVLSLVFGFGGVGVLHTNTTLLSWLSLATALDVVSGNVTASITNNLSTLANPIPAGVFTIVWTARDAALNTGTASQTLTITQEDPPPITSSGLMSGSVDFVVGCEDIITDAYRILGCLAEGESLTAYRRAYAQRQKNIMIKYWTTIGYHLWTIYQNQLPLVAGQPNYSLGSGGNLNMPRPLKILSATLLDSNGNETPLTQISRKEYFDLPTKASVGQAVNYYYDPGFTGSARTPKGILYVWPVAQAGTTDSINFTYSQYIQDYDAVTDDTPLPVEWVQAIEWQLAYRLGPSENVNPNDLAMIKTIADEFLNTVNAWDNDSTTGIQFGSGYNES